eukprot:c10713_g1_i2.p3 GENE.c10713_g1_i2~~c10713_g1_i2.p3  ORF type:complete len:107 (+),score=32.93 c10713_g1_i2:1061-1381(+)
MCVVSHFNGRLGCTWQFGESQCPSNNMSSKEKFILAFGVITTTLVLVMGAVFVLVGRTSFQQPRFTHAMMPRSGHWIFTSPRRSASSSTMAAPLLSNADDMDNIKI